MAWSRLLTFALLAAAVTGCGSSSSSLTTTDAARLHRDVAGIRAAAGAHNPAATHRAVRTLEADISQLRAANRIAPADASVLLTDAGQVDRKVPKAASTGPSSGAAAAPGPGSQAPGPQAPGPQPPAKGKDKPKGKGHGDGNGGGGGDGGD